MNWLKEHTLYVQYGRTMVHKILLGVAHMVIKTGRDVTYCDAIAFVINAITWGHVGVMMAKIMKFQYPPPSAQGRSYLRTVTSRLAHCWASSCSYTRPYLTLRLWRQSDVINYIKKQDSWFGCLFTLLVSTLLIDLNEAGKSLIFA